MEHRLLSVQELAAFLGIPVSTVYHECGLWGIDSYKIGKHLRFRESEVLAWLESRKTRD